MTYKLAKELKEAGFPQEAEYFWVKVFNNYEKWAYEMVIKDGLTGREYYAIPTLSAYFSFITSIGAFPFLNPETLVEFCIFVNTDSLSLSTLSNSA